MFDDELDQLATRHALKPSRRRASIPADDWPYADGEDLDTKEPNEPEGDE
jgi:hypothetical protein